MVTSEEIEQYTTPLIDSALRFSSESSFGESSMRRIMKAPPSCLKGSDSSKKTTKEEERDDIIRRLRIPNLSQDKIFCFAQWLATGLDFDKIVDIILKKGLEVLSNRRFTVISSFYPITKVKGTEVTRLRKVTPAEYAKAKAMFELWKHRSRMQMGTTFFLYTFLTKPEEFLPIVERICKFEVKTYKPLVINLPYLGYWSIKELNLLIEGWERWKEATGTNNVKYFNIIKVEIALRTSSIKHLKKVKTATNIPERPLASSNLKQTALDIMVNNENINKTPPRLLLDPNCFITWWKENKSRLEHCVFQKNVQDLSYLGVNLIDLFLDIEQNGSRLIELSSRCKFNLQNTQDRVAEFTNGEIIYKQAPRALKELRATMIQTKFGREYVLPFSPIAIPDFFQLLIKLTPDEILVLPPNLQLYYHAEIAIKVENLLRTNKVFCLNRTTVSHITFCSTSQEPMEDWSQFLNLWLNQTVTKELADQIEPKKLTCQHGFIVLPSKYLASSKQKLQTTSSATTKDIKGTFFDQVLAMRIGAGTVWYMNTANRYVVIGNCLNFHSFGLSPAIDSHVIRFIGASALGFKKGEIKGWAIHQSSNDGLFVLNIIMPDEDWDLLSNAFRQGIIFYPQTVESVGLNNRLLPYVNCAIYEPCFGNLNGHGKKYRNIQDYHIQPAIASARVHSAANLDASADSFAGYVLPEGYIKTLAEIIEPTLKTEDKRCMFDVIMNRIINYVGFPCLTYGNSTKKTSHSIQRPFYDQKTQRWEWIKLKDVPPPVTTEPFSKALIYLWFKLKDANLTKTMIFGGNYSFTKGTIKPVEPVHMYDIWYNCYKGVYGLTGSGTLMPKRSCKDSDCKALAALGNHRSKYKRDVVTWNIFV